MVHVRTEDAPKDVLNEVREVLKPPLGKVPDVNRALDVLVELPVVVLLDVESIFAVALAVITFVLTICDVVLLVYALNELLDLML